MAGRIRASDVEEVKRRTNIVDLVSDHVALKAGGIDSLKGLCPFHDERSPSFHVRPSLGYYHCFGCGESGDSITFLQRMDHLTFAEAVERLAARAQVTLTYEESSGGRAEDAVNRARLLAANEAAAKFYQQQLASEEAQTAREFLAQRGFDEHACARFGVGYAPKGWDALTSHLTKQGFSKLELVTSGLASEGQRGIYDRFRGRIVWPIRDTSGQTLGFGARKLYDDDTGPKYLNTPETPVYHKSRVLYGLDLAKREISRAKRVVVVEGYTDVMACHLAGVETAVATCGTAFGRDHISMLRRVMGDDAAAEVIFTFDPDEAGQKAALRAFSDEKLFRAQTYVAVAPDGYDPADLRLHRGDEAVRSLFEQKSPLFEFALRQAIAKFNLNTVEGRVSALRASAPIVAEIKDPALRPGYARELARMLGVDLSEVQQAVRAAGARRSSASPQQSAQQPGGQATYFAAEPAAHQLVQATATLSQLPQTPTVRLERDALMAMLQQPAAVGSALMSQAVTAQITDATLVVVRDAMAAALPHVDSADWFERVLHEAPEPYRALIRELAVAPMPTNNPQAIGVYSADVVASLLERDLLSLKAQLMSRLQRIGDSSSDESRNIQEQLAALELARRSLRPE